LQNPKIYRVEFWVLFFQTFIFWVTSDCSVSWCK